MLESEYNSKLCANCGATLYNKSNWYNWNDIYYFFCDACWKSIKKIPEFKLMEDKMSKPHEDFPEKFDRIVTDVKMLKRRSYQVDLDDKSHMETVRKAIAEAEDILLIDKEKGTVEDNIIGFGLAACQLKAIMEEDSEAPRVGIIRIPKMAKRHEPLILNMINPQIIDMTDKFKYKGEGCLSFPGDYKSTQRYRVIKVGFVDADTLKPREIDLYGFEAVVLQHEIDHQDGILYTDRVSHPAVAEKKIGPNDKCSCGSGKKYKKCCM